MSNKLVELPKRVKDKRHLAKRRIHKTQNQHIKRNYDDYEIIKEYWVSSKTTLFQIIQIFEEDDASHWKLYARNENGLLADFHFEEHKSLEDASEVLESIKLKNGAIFDVIDCQYPKVKKFIKQHSKHPESASHFKGIYDLRFIIALLELHEQGCEISSKLKIEPTKRLTNEKLKRRKSRNRRIARRLSNINIMKDNRFLRKELLEGFSKIVKGGIKESVIVAMVYRIAYFYDEVAKLYPDIYTDYEYIFKTVEGVIDTLMSKHLISPHSPGGTIKRSESHPMIPIDHLQILLDTAFEISLPLYNYIIVALSTALRPTEVKRLVENPDLYIIDGALLDYKGAKLITKTFEHVDPQIDYINPPLSVIARVLLKYNHPINPQTGVTVEEFFDIDGDFRRKKGFERYYERALRTTAGHMIGYCVKARYPHQANIHTVKEMMAHKNLKQAIEIYAKHLPHPTMVPEKYFNVSGIDISYENEKLLITENQALWQAFLLKDWITKMTKRETKTNMKIIWNQIVTEYKGYKLISAKDEDYKNDEFKID